MGSVFGVAPEHAPRFSLYKLEPILDTAHSRLDGVVLENLPWEEVVNRWDSPTTLCYLDPPYWGGEKDYGKNMFRRGDYQRIAEVLKTIKCAFIMSINDVPEIREIFNDFHFAEVSLTYTISKGGGKEASELIIIHNGVKTGLI